MRSGIISLWRRRRRKKKQTSRMRKETRCIRCVFMWCIEKNKNEKVPGEGFLCARQGPQKEKIDHGRDQLLTSSMTVGARCAASGCLRSLGRQPSFRVSAEPTLARRPGPGMTGAELFAPPTHALAHDADRSAPVNPCKRARAPPLEPHNNGDVVIHHH